MLQTFHAFPIRAAVAAVNVLVVNTAKGNTTAAIEIDYDFEWLMTGN
jgi:hypothetical protein